MGLAILPHDPSRSNDELARALFHQPESLGAVEDLEQAWMLSPRRAMVGHTREFTVVINRELAYTTVLCTLDDAPTWLLEEAERGDVLVATMQSTAELDGHMIFRGGRLVVHRANFEDFEDAEETDEPVDDEEGAPETGDPSYVPRLVERFTGEGLEALLRSTTWELFAV